MLESSGGKVPFTVQRYQSLMSSPPALYSPAAQLSHFVLLVILPFSPLPGGQSHGIPRTGLGIVARDGVLAGKNVLRLIYTVQYCCMQLPLQHTYNTRKLKGF